MPNWLERAKRDIPAVPDRATANTDERTPTAVEAVPERGAFEISPPSIDSNGSAPLAGYLQVKAVVPMTAGEEAAIRAWLAHIEETDDVIIKEVLNRCRSDVDARRYFLGRSKEVPYRPTFDDDRGAATTRRADGGSGQEALPQSLNLSRRHLTTGQRAAISAEIDALSGGTNQHTAIAATSQAEAAQVRARRGGRC